MSGFAALVAAVEAIVPLSAVVPLGAFSHSTVAAPRSYRLDSRVCFLVSGFAALAAVVEAVVPLLSGSTALTIAVVPLRVQDLAPLLCAAVPLGETAVPLAQR